MDIAEIQKKLSVYAECLVKSLKNKKIQTTPSESLSSLYGIGKLDGETLENSIMMYAKKWVENNLVESEFLRYLNKIKREESAKIKMVFLLIKVLVNDANF